MAAPTLLLFLLACTPRESDGITVTGDLGGQAFNPGTVVFDELGAGPYDTAGPEDQQIVVVLADADDVCPLLGPLYHYWWSRCESACNGLFEPQDLWPADELRVLWVGITVDEVLEDTYTLAASDSPGMFSANYRPVDLSLLADHDAASCFEACTENYGFLLTDQGRANTGDLELTGYDVDILEGSFDVLLSQGEVSASFDAPLCEMGLH